MLTIGSLFSGVGGLELGLEWAGLGPVLFQVEKNQWRQDRLIRTWPQAQLFGRIETVGAHNLPRVDLLCGGFPCQDVSSAGTRKGLAGSRSGLWTQFARIVEEITPAWVVVENVAGGATRWLDAVVLELEKQGYACLPIPLAAEDVGAPHRRARIFVVARRVPDADRVELRKRAERRPRRSQGGVQDEGQPESSDEGQPESSDVGSLAGALPDAAGIERGSADDEGATKRRGRSWTRKALARSRKRGVADTVGERSDEGAEQHAGPREPAPEQRGELVADADGFRPEEQPTTRLHTGRPQRDDAARRRAPTDEPPRHAVRWPPGPTDVEGWARYVADGGPQPAIRGGVDGLSDWARDETLSALGDAVVPQCAEVVGWVIRYILETASDD